MMIAVTEEDIANGKPASAAHCPIALAMARTLGGVWSVNLVRAHRLDGEPVVYGLSVDGRAFVRSFDAGHPVKPTTLRLRRIR